MEMAHSTRNSINWMLRLRNVNDYNHTTISIDDKICFLFGEERRVEVARARSENHTRPDT